LLACGDELVRLRLQLDDEGSFDAFAFLVWVEVLRVVE
jgi:hypothetical protein